jgi:CheY-like chemotaxis protein
MSERIMLVDDDIDDQLIFREIVQEITAQVECFTAANGLEALGLLNQMQPSPAIIFLDLNMPLVNGWEFLERVKKNDKMNQIPVIILTTSNDKTDKKKAIDHGARMFLTKTADLPSLRQSIREILKGEHLLE